MPVIAIVVRIIAVVVVTVIVVPIPIPIIADVLVLLVFPAARHRDHVFEVLVAQHLG